jgi:hypothetical protein
MHLARRAHGATSRPSRADGDDFYRFEDQANDILRVHVRRLDVHRRSILLFYLVFGLIAGFIIGLVGARGVHAAPSIAEPVPGAMGGSSLLDLNGVGLRGGKLAAIQGLEDEALIALDAADSGVTPEPERYAALLLPKISDATYAAPAGTGRYAHSGHIPGKAFVMSALISVLGIASILAMIFWTHLGRAYSPRRRLPNGGWPPQ